MTFQSRTYQEALEQRQSRPQRPRKLLARRKALSPVSTRPGQTELKSGSKAQATVKGKKSKRKKLPGTKTVQSKFNLMVRERANWVCVKCGRDYSARRGLLHASHFWAVGFTATRFDFDNVDALCYPCHYGQMRTGWEYNKQGDYRTYMINKLGQDGYDALEQKARSGMKLLDAKELFLNSLKPAQALNAGNPLLQEQLG